MKEAAELLGVSTQRVRQYIGTGRIIAYKLVCRWRIMRSSLSDLRSRRGRLKAKVPAPAPMPVGRDWITTVELSRRWGLPMEMLHQIVEDGWMTMSNKGIPLSEVEDLEEMGMPEKWRKRLAAGSPMTPSVLQNHCGHGYDGV